jgi:AcrR family transcriptional regulator
MLTGRPRLDPVLRRRSTGLKTAVLDAARRLCLVNGVDGVSARKIAKEVGCSATAIYLYYKSLDDLLNHLRMEGYQLLAQYFREVDGTLPPLDRLLEMGRAYYRFGVEHPNYYRLMFLHRFREVLRRELIRQEIVTLLAVRGVIRAGIDSGAIRADLDPMVLANGAWSTVHGLTSLAVAGLLPRTAPGQETPLLEGALESIRKWLSP